MILRTYTDRDDNENIGFVWNAKKETKAVLEEQRKKAKKALDNYYNSIGSGTANLFGETDGIPDFDKFKEYTKDCNEELLKGINYQTKYGDATKRLGQNVNGATKSFKTLRSVGKSLLSGLANFGVAMLIETAISAVVRLVDDYINRFENRAEEVKEKAEQWENELSTLESNEKSVKDIQDEYYSLADGVDAYGNNISLTSEQYERYIELSNQIANMYPDLVASYDAQGNAILACKNNADLLTQSLKDSKEAYY